MDGDDVTRLRAIQAAFDKALDGVELNGIATGWVAMVEVTNADGTANLLKAGAEGAPQWRADGLLFHGLHGGGWDEVEEDDDAT